MFNPEDINLPFAPDEAWAQDWHPLNILPFQSNEVTIHLMDVSATLDISLCCQRLPEVLIGYCINLFVHLLHMRQQPPSEETAELSIYFKG